MERGNVIGLVLGLLLVATAQVASAAPLWSLDFENGFTASSGDVEIVGGDAGDPYNTGNMVYLRTHGSRPGNYEARIGAGLDPTSLRYENLDPSILGPSGTIKFDIRVGVAGYPNSMASMIAVDYAVGSGNYWYVGMSKPHRFIVRSSSYDGDKGVGWERQYILDVAQPLSTGWHTMEFSWNVTAPHTATTRTIADISMVVDGQPAWNADGIAWSRSGQTCLGLGSRRTSAGTYYPIGNEYIMMDNIEIIPEPATMLLMLGGAALSLRKKK